MAEPCCAECRHDDGEPAVRDISTWQRALDQAQHIAADLRTHNYADRPTWTEYAQGANDTADAIWHTIQALMEKEAGRG